MIVLGSCDNCTDCGSYLCDKIVILIGNGLEPANALSFFTYGEGNPVSITVARLAKHEYGYHGTPADFESEQGYPPPVADGSFYLDWDTGNYWLNTGGVFAVGTPPNHGNGTISVDFQVQLTECGCPHMWTDETVTVSWADGDTANKTLTLTSPAHAGTVPYWSCPGNPFLGENAELAMISSTAGTGACVEFGYGVTLIAVCGHSVTNSGWGTSTPYQVRKWGAMYQSSAGIEGFLQENNYLSEECVSSSSSGLLFKYKRTFAIEGDIETEIGQTDHDNFPQTTGTRGRFIRPVSETSPINLVLDDGGLTNTSGTVDPSNHSVFLYDQTIPKRWIAGLVTSGVQMSWGGDWMAGPPYSGSWKLFKDGVEIDSGSGQYFYGPFGVYHSFSPQDSSSSADYYFSLTDGTYTSTSPTVQHVVIDQTVNTVTDSVVDVDGDGATETWSWSGTMTTQVLADYFDEARTRLDDLRIDDADGNLPPFLGAPDYGFFGWNQEVPEEWTWEIRASNPNYDFSDPGFDSSKTYSFSGSELPAEPFDPADWTEVSDTGYDERKTVHNWSHGTGLSGIRSNMAIAGTSAGRRRAGSEFFLYECTIDATRSASGSPYPYKVEIRLKTYEDGTLVDTSAWIDITDTVYSLDAPTTLAGAANHHYITAEFQLTPLAGATCDPTISPVFVCHPGLSC